MGSQRVRDDWATEHARVHKSENARDWQSKVSYEVIIEQRQRWSEGTNCANIWWKRVLRRNNRCQGPCQGHAKLVWGNIWRPAWPIGSKQGGNDGWWGICRWARCLLLQVWQRQGVMTTVWKTTVVVVSVDWGSDVGRKTLSSVYSFECVTFFKSCAWITF